MTAEERNKYIEFMYDYKNEYNCENCPENRGDFHMTNYLADNKIAG